MTKVITELIEKQREIYGICPNCKTRRYLGSFSVDCVLQNGETECINCSALFRWQEVNSNKVDND